ncbi:TRAP transporter large permease [Salicibibacter kimchii]|uniref:TRAP transporter large permease n=1 Tax=Salicibibacter kimchii TaxID=2099786 RepID=A0A345C191_9BACI|nr:TRAP transporter large permease [Salicibibacter kimchii]AXF56972.1 TRAP transporter large permease [Salicibibacter kimchii]
MSIVLVLLFFVLLLMGIPISLVLGIMTVLYFLTVGEMTLLDSTPQQFFSSLENYGLLAIPLFMLAGELMNSGGITSRLVRFAKVIIGHLRGGLAYVSIIANMFLASILGSANAQIAVMSKTLVPEMEKEGYDRSYSTALTMSSSIIAPMLPPSMIFIIYGSLSGTSIGALFMAGIAPGILFAIGFIVLTAVMGYLYNFPKSERATGKEIVKSAYAVLPALSIPFIIIFGILSGWFTPTESAGIGCLLAFLIGKFFYRELKFKNLSNVFINTALSTSTITFLIAMAGAFGWMIAFEQIPQTIADGMLSISENPLIFLLMVNLMLIVLGTVLEGIAALVILVPVFMPLIGIYDIDPIHFGIIISINLTIGLLTPPVGTGLFIASSIARVKFERLIISIIPFLIMSIILLFVITYWEDLVLFLPRMLGY